LQPKQQVDTHQHLLCWVYGCRVLWFTFQLNFEDDLHYLLENKGWSHCRQVDFRKSAWRTCHM